MSPAMTRHLTLIPLVLPVLACQACGHGQPVAPEAPAPDETVTITGTAANAKLSAVVIKDDVPYYLIDLDAWPEHVTGKQVAVTGILEETDEYEAQVDESGAISQGTEGPILLLRSASYEVHGGG